ncbi:hypothetical protein ACI3EY_03665 [Ornithinimicrobium sp. LYQ92]|uniref:hypothetical protein n=1 Tax=Serinicoccus sp. LYQ92 TaxID=3378798 RepID=UPI003852614B
MSPPRLDGMVRTRDGDLVPADTLAPHTCERGWVGPAANPAPCPVCRPGTVARLAEQRRRADERRAGPHHVRPAALRPSPSAEHTPTDPPALAGEPEPTRLITTTKEQHAMSNHPQLSLCLTADDRDLVVAELRATADTITSTATHEAASIVAGSREEQGRDPRTLALHLAQRLARALDLRRIADELATATSAPSADVALPSEDLEASA